LTPTSSPCHVYAASIKFGKDFLNYNWYDAVDYESVRNPEGDGYNTSNFQKGGNIIKTVTELVKQWRIVKVITEMWTNNEVTKTDVEHITPENYNDRYNKYYR
jgi:hypothetical protein